MNSGNTHETSSIKFTNGETFSFTPTVKGGTAPYTWSASALPSGVSINSSTGEISGTVTQANGYSTYNGKVSVVDANGNTASRKTNISVNSITGYPNYICDRDQDGMCSDFPGCSTYYNTSSCPLHGGDSNDFDANETPNQAYLQPPPTGLTKGTVTSSTVALSWTAPAERLDTYMGIGGNIRKMTNGFDLNYQVYHGTNGTTYPDVVSVGRATSYTWTGLSSGTHYFTVSAVEFRGLESAPSNSINQTLGEADVTPPTLVSATIPSAGTTISLTFDEAVNRTAGGTLTLSMTGGAVTMTYSSGTGTTTLVYTLSRTIYQGETGTFSWTTAANKIEDSAGNDWASVSNFAVTNSSTYQPTVGFNGSAFGAYWVEGWAGSYSNGGSITQTSDGGIAIAGPTWSYAWPSGPSSPSDLPWGTPCIMLVKASIDGVEAWRKISCSTGYNVTTKQRTSIGWYANKIIASGTNLIVAGTRDAIDGYTHGFLIKYDSSGTLVWDRSFVGTGGRNDDVTDVVEITGGGFALCGTSYDGSYNGVWLVLTDANGQNATQHYYYYLSKGYAHGLKIRKTADGGYIMVGYTQTGSSPDEDIYAVKVTSDGTPVWNNLYDNAGRRDYANGVEEDGSGNYWIFARSRLPGSENTRIWIVKAAYADGALLASYEIGDSVVSHAYVPKQSVKLASGNFLILGYTNQSSGTGYHGYLTEINTSGVVQGTPQAIGVTTGYTEDYIYDGVVSADGNYYLLVGNDNGAFSTAYDFWYLKMAVSDRSIQNHTTCTTKTTYYYDKDLDGLGNNNQWDDPTAECCFAMPGYVLGHTDQDDSIPGILGTATGAEGVGVEIR